MFQFIFCAGWQWCPGWWWHWRGGWRRCFIWFFGRDRWRIQPALMAARSTLAVGGALLIAWKGYKGCRNYQRRRGIVARIAIYNHVSKSYCESKCKVMAMSTIVGTHNMTKDVRLEGLYLSCAVYCIVWVCMKVDGGGWVRLLHLEQTKEISYSFLMCLLGHVLYDVYRRDWGLGPFVWPPHNMK